MKINKTLIIISLLLIFCISLGAVSAADNTDMSVNDINNDDIATVESSVNVDEEISTVSEEGQINKSSEIYEDIKSATGTYNITTDYQIDTTWEIPNANVIIEGNNHTIYGNGKQAFRITGNSVTIKNLNFVGCSADSGGAIYWSGSDGVVGNCCFVNCSSSGRGGAIYWSGSDGVVGNCCFVNCSSGGAICFDNAGSVGNCSFVSCSNAIFYRASGSVSNCSFVNCSSGGGAISFGGSGVVGNVSGCSFVNCMSGGSGGAISFGGSGVVGNVSGCSFVNCMSGGSGGAIFWSGYDGIKAIVNCCFVNCSSSGSGGAIYLDRSSSVGNCCFVNCSSSGSGGAIYLDRSSSVGNCSFVGCSASNGGAIYWSGSDGVVGNCCFVNCSSSGSGGAIYLDSSSSSSGSRSSSVGNCSFVGCSASNGGAIYFKSRGVDNVRGCCFVNCSGGSGGAIYFDNTGSVNYCIFDNNRAPYAKDIFGNSEGDYDFNFFSFKNDMGFPKYLIGNGKHSIIPDYWVVLEVTDSDDSYFVEFVTDEGSSLSENMPDYTACLSINGVAKEIFIKNNTYNDAYVDGNYVVTSLNSGNVLANVTFKNDTNCSMNVTVNNITVGDVAHVVVTLPEDAMGYVELYINDEYYRDTGVRSGVATFNISGLAPGNYNIKAVYSGDNKYPPTNASVNLTVSNIPEHDIEVNASGIYDDCINGSINVTYNGTITFTIGSTNCTGKVVDGKFSVNIKGIDAKTYEGVHVRFVSDDGDFIGNAVINLTISPKNLDLNGFINNASFGTNLTGIVVTNGKTGKVNVTINSVVYTGFVDSEGHFILNGTDSLSVGSYDNVLVNFVSDDGNCFGNMTVSFTIIVAPTIDNAVVSGNYSETVSFNITIHYAQSGDEIVLHLPNGANITKIYEGNDKVEFTVVLPFACNGITTDVICVRDGVGCAVGTVTWNINKIDTNISFVPTNVTTSISTVYGVEVIVVDSYDNLVTQGKIKVTGEGVTLIDSNDGIYDFVDGKVTIKFKYDAVGDYKLNIKYLGGVATNNTDNYNNSTKDLSVSVLADVLDTYIVSNYNGDNAFDGKMGEQLTLNFTVYDKNGNLVNNGNLSIILDGKVYTATVINGHASITNESFVWTSSGLYSYVVNYISVNNAYADSFNFTKVNILKSATHIKIEGSINDTNKHLVIKVLDDDGDYATKGTVYYVSPDGIGHHINVNGSVIELDVPINRTGKYDIAVSYYDLDGDYLYSSASFNWNVQLTTTLIKVSNSADGLLVAIKVADEKGNGANGKVDLFFNGKLMALNVVNGVGSANIGHYNGPVELNAVFTGEDCLSSYDKVIVECINTPENAINHGEIEEINSLETDSYNNTEDNSTDVNDEFSDVNNEESSENSVKKSFASGIPMEHTAIPILALLMTLLTLPIIRRRK